MENKENTNEGFSYTYSAKEQAEIKKIRQKYAPKTEDPMERLRRLDDSVTSKATAVALVLGIVGALILGLGMSCVLVWAEKLFFAGIVIGVIGIGIVLAAYPVYEHIVKRERARIAPEIIRLTDELLK